MDALLSKRQWYILFLLLVLNCCLLAQENGPKYKAWIETYNETSLSKGYLHELKDSSIIIRPSSSLIMESNRFNEIPIKQINQLKFRKKARVGKGILLGFLGGFGVGALLSFTLDDNPCQPGSFFCSRPSQGEKAVSLGLLAGISGAIIGGFIGSAKVKIPINGDLNKYISQKKELEKYLLPN